MALQDKSGKTSLPLDDNLSTGCKRVKHYPFLKGFPSKSLFFAVMFRCFAMKDKSGLNDIYVKLGRFPLRFNHQPFHCNFNKLQFNKSRELESENLTEFMS